MQEFSESNGMDLIQLIQQVNKNIDTILYSAEPLPLEPIEHLAELIQQREELFTLLTKWRSSTEGTQFVSNNINLWSQTISTMEQDDVLRVEVLRQKKERSGRILQQRVSKKNVLLYQQTGV